jgi:hypothetical protein
VQYICKVRLRADGSKDAQTSSDKESEAEVGEVEEESNCLQLWLIILKTQKLEVVLQKEVVERL